MTSALELATVALASLSAGLAASALTVAVLARRVLREVRGLRRDEQATRATVNHLATAIAGSQAWYWTTEWQEGEREADEDIAAGRTVKFGSVDEMDHELDLAAKRYDDCNV